MTIATADYRYSGQGFRNPILGIVAGVSDAANRLISLTNSIQESRLNTITGSQEATFSSKAFQGLMELHSENELSFEALKEAISFLQLLPAELEIPEADIEPNGAISFEWYKDPLNVFVISINGTQNLEFATLMGRGNELHGKMRYFGELPPPIKMALETFLTE